MKIKPSILKRCEGEHPFVLWAYKAGYDIRKLLTMRLIPQDPIQIISLMVDHMVETGELTEMDRDALFDDISSKYEQETGEKLK